MPGADPPDTAAGLGRRVRELRREHQLSAHEVAQRAGVSPAYLSRLENGKVSPTVATLTRVVQAMGESVGALFQDTVNGPLVRRDQRRRVNNRGVTDDLVTPSSAARLEILETLIDPGAGSGGQPYTHPGDEECVLMLQGGLQIWIDGARYDLGEGDAVTFACRTPHRWHNGTADPARALWVITPAGY
jgi:transcriptional regulator with XRE-family HTH domain